VFLDRHQAEVRLRRAEVHHQAAVADLREVAVRREDLHVQHDK
jgi:hypothetical protein